MRIRQTTAIVLNRSEIRDFEWSVPFWDEIMTSDARRGIVRHGVDQARNYVPVSYKPDYGEHFRRFLGSGAHDGLLLALGFRNTGPNNLGLPGFDRRRNRPLFSRSDEPWQWWTYFGFVKFADGSFQLSRLRFHGSGGSEIILPDEPDRSADVVWAITGQPVIWDGLVPSCLAALTYDLRHIWRLNWESHQQERLPECRHHQEAHAALMLAFMQHLHDSATERCAKLWEIAARYGLRAQDRYLHSSLGIRADGALILLAHRGSLAEVGTKQASLGASRAILLDNGGSVGYAIWSAATRHQRRIECPVYIGNASYFRPMAHSVGILKLDLESLEDGAFGSAIEDKDIFG